MEDTKDDFPVLVAPAVAIAMETHNLQHRQPNENLRVPVIAAHTVSNTPTFSVLHISLRINLW